MALLTGTALAQTRARVAVLRFEGAPKLQAAVAETLAKEHHLVPLSEWEATASELSATGFSADQIAIVAMQVRADAVVTGLVRRDERGVWMITVSARQGQSGKAVVKQRFPLRSATTLRELLAFVGPAVQQALAQSGPPGGAGAGGVDEAPLSPQELEEALQRSEPPARPVWYPYVDLGVGLLFGGRRLDFEEDFGRSPVGCYDFRQPVVDPNNPTGPGAGVPLLHQFSNQLQRCPRFPTAVTGGLRIDATVYPLAARRSRWLRGLGLGLTADLPFWPATATCNASNPDASCAGRVSLATREYRVEAGLRWAINLLDKRSRVSLLLSLHYGVHSFALEKTSRSYEFFDPVTNARVQVDGLDDRGLPDSKLQYLSLGVGARVPYYANRSWAIGLVVDARYHAMLSHGEISARFNDESSLSALYQGGGYGPISSSHGLRVQVTPIEVMPWRGLTFRLSGYYETFLLRFAVGEAYLSGPNPIEPQNLSPSGSARHIARGATEQYFGGALQVGYQF